MHDHCRKITSPFVSRQLSGLCNLCREEGDQELSIELAACKLLLGDIAAAEAALHIGPSDTQNPDAGVLDFIQVAAQPQLAYGGAVDTFSENAHLQQPPFQLHPGS